MANLQPITVQNHQNAVNANEMPLTAITSFLRFLYTGSSASSIPLKSAPNIEDIDTKLACVIDMATARALLPISTIRKVYQGKMYVRVDEVLIALAYCAKQTHSEELRVLANNEAISLITNQNDFLRFVYYCIKISSIVRGEGNKNFGHGMCRVVEKWYEKWSPVDLANMFGEHRGICGLTHESVIKKAHMRIKKRTNTVQGAAALTVNTSNSAAQAVGGSVLATNSNNSSNTQTQGAPSSNTNEDDREQVLHFVFTKGSLNYLKYLEDKNELGPGAQRLKNLQILKTNENIENAVESISEHKFTLEQMPAHLLEKDKVWTALLPTLSSKKLLDNFHTLKDHGFFSESSTFTQNFIDVFCNSTKIKEEKICPILLYIQKQFYDKNVRYLSTKKAEFYEQKCLKRNIKKNEVIKEKLDEMFHLALFKAAPASAKFMVVIDLRRSNAKKPILRNKHINCFEASFLLAYSIFVREKNTLVYSFTGIQEKLEPLHSLMPRNNFEMAKEALDLVSVPRTNQSLAQPILEAMAQKKKVDIFLVVVDSVARFCRQGKVPIKEFTEYKAKFNDRAKYVVVNLCRPVTDLKIPQTDNMKGFFEICGFNQDTPKILNALATHCFT